MANEVSAALDEIFRVLQSANVPQLESIIEWLGNRGVLVYLAVLLIVSGTWGFIALSDQVREGDTQRFDDRANRFFFTHRGPAWLQEAGRDITGLGSAAGLALVVLAVAGFLLITRRYASCLLILLTTGGGFALTMSLKHLFERPRPPLQPSGLVLYTTSFPSGHSMLSAVIYLTIGGLMARFTPGRRVKLYLVCVALCLTFLVGLSRVYLCAHYPSDVLAGWSAGLTWAILCWLVARALQHRNAVERDIPATQQTPD